ncbi:MAG: hypothetical protein ACKOEO_06000 [Planctomycetaceae bacterium]
MVTTTKYVWDPVFDCVTHELDENNAVKAVYHNEPQQYGGVLSQRRGNTSHYHHHDAMGSTRFLTDSSGTVTDTYLKDAWGNSISTTGSTINPYRWAGACGYYTDNRTGQLFIRSAVYSPTAARIDSLQVTSLRPSQLKAMGDSKSPFTVDISYSSERNGPKCGGFAYEVLVTVTAAIEWYERLLIEFGVSESPQLLVFQHFHELLTNRGCESTISQCGDIDCVAGTLDQQVAFDLYEYIDWSRNVNTGDVKKFLPRRNPKSKQIINYTFGFYDVHTFEGYGTRNRCIENRCGADSSFQHIRIFWKDQTRSKSSGAPVHFGESDWPGGDVTLSDPNLDHDIVLRGNLTKSRPIWWDDVKPAFVYMLRHDNKYCCCKDSYDVGQTSHRWSARKPDWWYE